MNENSGTVVHTMHTGLIRPFSSFQHILNQHQPSVRMVEGSTCVVRTRVYDLSAKQTNFDHTHVNFKSSVINVILSIIIGPIIAEQQQCRRRHLQQRCPSCQHHQTVTTWCQSYKCHLPFHWQVNYFIVLFNAGNGGVLFQNNNKLWNQCCQLWLILRELFHWILMWWNEITVPMVFYRDYLFELCSSGRRFCFVCTFKGMKKHNPYFWHF